MQQPPPFDAAAFQSHLRTRAIGRVLTYRLSTTSTMTIAAREASEGAVHGTMVLAEEQTAGVGRRGRSFHSPNSENLYFTLILRLPSESNRLLPVALPVAVAAAVRALGVDASIKWPNDIWASGLKISGMLIDLETSDNGPVALAGVGINVNGDPTIIPELRGVATSLRRELGRKSEREPLLADICNGLEGALDVPHAIVGRYRSLSLILGHRVIVHPAAGEAFEAKAVGIDEDGALEVERKDGTLETVVAADVSVRPAG